MNAPQGKLPLANRKPTVRDAVVIWFNTHRDEWASAEEIAEYVKLPLSSVRGALHDLSQVYEVIVARPDGKVTQYQWTRRVEWALGYAGRRFPRKQQRIATRSGKRKKPIVPTAQKANTAFGAVILIRIGQGEFAISFTEAQTLYKDLALMFAPPF